MRFTPTALPGVVVVEPDVYRDDRGFFLETFHLEKYRAGGIDAVFVQDNHSRSVKGTLRGLHLQVGRAQGKLVRAVRGEMWDVAADVRRGSPTFGQWVGVHLTGDGFQQVYVPPGFAHGFCVLSDEVDVEYKCSDFYDRGSEVGIAWNDPDLAIRWPLAAPLVSAKDQQAPLLRDALERLPVFTG